MNKRKLMRMMLIFAVILAAGVFNKIEKVTASGDYKVYLPMVVNQLGGKSYYVSPNGSARGDGSMSNPWDLQTALDHPAKVEPGDTIWLRGGVYEGQFESHLKGSSDGRIVVRQYPGERATLESTGLIIDIQDTYYVDFWGFEVTSNNNPRDPDTRPLWAFGVRAHQGYESNNVRFINMFIHDMPAQGFGWWVANSNSEIYGSLIFYNGVTELDHGVYTKNQYGDKSIIDNFIFDNASHGIHAYSSTDDTLNNYYLIGNTIFNNGSIGFNTIKDSYGVYKRNILVGGYVTVNNAIIKENATYYPGTSGQSLNLGYNAGSSNAVVADNYLMGGEFQLGGTNSNLSMSGNTIYASSFLGFSPSSYPSNSFEYDKPDGVNIIVRPNEFEKNRANVTIYNWNKYDHVTLSASDLAGLGISAGDHYELHNVQDYYGDVVTGIYDGHSISVPMTGHSVQQPLGLDFKPDSTFPEFGGFVLIFN